MLRSVATTALSVLLATLTLFPTMASPETSAQPTVSATEEMVSERATTVSRSARSASRVEPTLEPSPVVQPIPQPVATRQPVVVPSVADARAYALEQVGAAQFACLDALWQHESDWNPSARNPSSGAYGIPQSLPPGKMSSMADDWADNPLTQVQWGLWYIRLSYGSSCRAWSFWLAHNPHWY